MFYKCLRGFVEILLKLINSYITHGYIGRQTLICANTFLCLYDRVQSSMSCNNVEPGHIMWILYWWHRFPFSFRQWGLGVGWGKEKKKNLAIFVSHQNTAKLITLYPTLDNNAQSCLSEYYSINVWFAVQPEWLHI